jgi:hypothetical protein
MVEISDDEDCDKETINLDSDTRSTKKEMKKRELESKKRELDSFIAYQRKRKETEEKTRLRREALQRLKNLNRLKGQ